MLTIGKLFITRNNPTQSETYEIRNLFAVEIHKVIVALFNLSVKHYNEFWELENSADEYWERVGYCSLALAYCISLISDDMVNNSEQIKNNKVAFLKHQAIYMVEKCKWLRYKGDSVWNGSRYVDNYINTWVLDSIRQAAVAQYDECVAEIQKNDPNYQPPIIARTGYTKSGGCYIATAVYGSYEAPEVMVLRKFRDEVLAKSLLGRVFIKTYYVLSPPVAIWLKSAKRINRIVKILLDNLVNKLQN